MSEDDIKLIDDAINNKLNKDETAAFNERMREDSFRQLYLNYLMDERLMIKALEINKLKSKGPQKQSKKIYGAAIIAFAASIFFAFILFQTPGIAVIDDAGLAHVIRQNKKIKVYPGLKLQSGDKIISEEKVKLTYIDKTTVELNSDSSIMIFQDEAGTKKIDLLKGDLTADVQPQKPGQEMQINTEKSKALILGTKFTISSNDSNSDLKVHKGKVEFFNTTGSKDYVKAGEYAKARKDAPVISRLSHISDKKKEADKRKWLRWKEHSKKIIDDPDTIAYYDFEDINPNQNQILNNKAKATKDLPLNGKVITTMAIEGRWHQKGSLYFSEYGYVDFQRHDIYNISGTMTIFAWMKVKKFDRGWQTVISKGDGSWRLARNRFHNYMEFCCNGLKPSPGHLFGKQEVNDGKWHLLVGTYDGEKMKLYVDGQLDVERPATGKVSSDDFPVNIGANAERRERDFEGWIDEVGILKRALSAEEVAELYEAGKP